MSYNLLSDDASLGEGRRRMLAVNVARERHSHRALSGVRQTPMRTYGHGWASSPRPSCVSATSPYIKRLYYGSQGRSKVKFNLIYCGESLSNCLYGLALA